jgi:hypothetical protein
VFGFAALAVQCLSTKKLERYDDLYNALEDVDFPVEIYQILATALSKEPEKRHPNACALLAAIESVQRLRQASWVKRDTIFLELTSNALQKLLKEFPAKNKDEICALIVTDLQAACGITSYKSDIPGSTEQFSMFGAALSFHLALHSANKYQLVILNASKLSPTIIEQRRDRAYVPCNEFRFGRTDEPYKAEAALLTLREQLELHEAAGREKDAEFK